MDEVFACLIHRTRMCLYFAFFWNDHNINCLSCLTSLFTEVEQIVAVFNASSRQKAWDHFSKAQRKNIDIWRKHCEVGVFVTIISIAFITKWTFLGWMESVWSARKKKVGLRHLMLCTLSWHEMYFLCWMMTWRQSNFWRPSRFVRPPLNFLQYAWYWMVMQYSIKFW